MAKRRGSSGDRGTAINVQSLSSGGSGSSLLDIDSNSIMTIIALIALVAIGIFAFKYLKKNPAAAAPAAEEVPPVTDGSAIPISPEPTCPAGEECVEDDQGRYDCDETKPDAYEATWCGSFSGDDLTIKLYGPQHSNDGDCCWCVLHIKPETGQFVGGGEGPHPSSNCEDKGDGESIGSSSDICVKAVIQPGPHITGYALVDGAWKQMIDYTSDCGCDETSSEKTGDQVTFRNDGDFNTTCATVKALGASTGGETPTTETPAPTNGEEEEPEEEEDEEDEEDEGNLARVLFSPVVRKEHRFVNSFREFGSLSYRGIRLGNF